MKQMRDMRHPIAPLAAGFSPYPGTASMPLRLLVSNSLYLLVKIAAALGVELWELFRFEREALDRKQVEAQVIHILQSLPDGDLNRMLPVLRLLYPVQ